jgi:hypothetical protein
LPQICGDETPDDLIEDQIMSRSMSRRRSHEHEQESGNPIGVVLSLRERNEVRATMAFKGVNSCVSSVARSPLLGK